MRMWTPLMLHLSAIITLLFQMSPATTVAAAAQRPITLPGCPDKCGNISIPYPFGTRGDCCFDGSFLVMCNN